MGEESRLYMYPRENESKCVNNYLKYLIFISVWTGKVCLCKANILLNIKQVRFVI